MPKLRRKPRYATTKTTKSLTPEHWFYLRSGVTLGNCPWPEEPDEDTLADIEQAWMRVGRAILERHIRQRPGTRPFGFWKFETTGRDKTIDEAEQLRRDGLLTEPEELALRQSAEGGD